MLLAILVGNTIGYVLFTIIIGEVILAKNETSTNHVQYVTQSDKGPIYNEGENISFLDEHIASFPTSKRNKDPVFFF